MRQSRGMGDIRPEKLPKKMRRKDDPQFFDMYAEGGRVKRKRKHRMKSYDK